MERLVGLKAGLDQECVSCSKSINAPLLPCNAKAIEKGTSRACVLHVECFVRSVVLDTHDLG